MLDQQCNKMYVYMYVYMHMAMCAVSLRYGYWDPSGVGIGRPRLEQGNCYACMWLDKLVRPSLLESALCARKVLHAA